MSNMNRSFEMFGSTPKNKMQTKDYESNNADMGSAYTPQYMISCEDFFSSNVEGMEDDSAPCLWVETGGARIATYDSSGELSGDGRIVCKDVVVCMKYGSWGPIIQQYMFEGKKLETIAIKRMISINGTKVIIQTITYGTCLIKTYEQSGDTITFTYCYVSLEDVNTAYGHDGTKVGNTGVKFDYSTLKSESVSG